MVNGEDSTGLSVTLTYITMRTLNSQNGCVVTFLGLIS